MARTSSATARSLLVLLLAAVSPLALAQQQQSSVYTAAELACYPYAYMEGTETGPVSTACLALNVNASAPGGAATFQMTDAWSCRSWIANLVQSTVTADQAIGEYWNCLQTSGFIFTLLTEEQMATAQNGGTISPALGSVPSTPVTPEEVPATPVEPVQGGSTTPAAPGSAEEAIQQACAADPPSCATLWMEYQNQQHDAVMGFLGARRLLSQQHRKAL